VADNLHLFIQQGTPIAIALLTTSGQRNHGPKWHYTSIFHNLRKHITASNVMVILNCNLILYSIHVLFK
jgi:hypothetical protein